MAHCRLRRARGPHPCASARPAASMSGKPQLIAQPLDEIDVQVAAIQIAVEIEHVRFEQQLLAVHRRPRTETRNSRRVLQTAARHADREDARQRRRAPMQPQVRGRKTQLAAELRAFESPCRSCDTAGRATSRARAMSPASSAARISELLTRSPSISNGGTSVTSKPRCGPGGTQRRDAARRGRARTGSRARRRCAARRAPPPARRSTNSSALIERMRCVEAQADEPIDAVARAAPRTSRESASGAPAASPFAKNSRGVGSNDNTTAGRRMLARALAQHPDHLLMTAMHAVERADRQHAAAMPRDARCAGPERAPSRPRAPNRSPDARHYRGDRASSSGFGLDMPSAAATGTASPARRAATGRRNRRTTPAGDQAAQPQRRGARLPLLEPDRQVAAEPPQQGRHRRARNRRCARACRACRGRAGGCPCARRPT